MRVLYLKRKDMIKWSVLVVTTFLLSFWTWHYVQQRQDQPTFKHYEPIYQGQSDKKRVSLICNVVWGEEYLPVMLQSLKKTDTKITFFVGGRFAEQFPELVEMIDKDGHEIGNHGYRHLHPTQITLSQNVEEIKKTETVLKRITKKNSKLFHPPYREINTEVADQVGRLGYKTIMSSIDTIDWQRPAPEVIINRVVPKLHNGAIILMHPTDPTAKALPALIQSIKDKGYDLVPVSKNIN